MGPPPRHRQRAALLALSNVAICTAQAFADEPLPASVTYAASARRAVPVHGERCSAKAHRLAATVSLPLLIRAPPRTRVQSPATVPRSQTRHKAGIASASAANAVPAVHHDHRLGARAARAGPAHPRSRAKERK